MPSLSLILLIRVAEVSLTGGIRERERLIPAPDPVMVRNNAAGVENGNEPERRGTMDETKRRIWIWVVMVLVIVEER